MASSTKAKRAISKIVSGFSRSASANISPRQLQKVAAAVLRRWVRPRSAR
jgi:hypothetical protein